MACVCCEPPCYQVSNRPARIIVSLSGGWVCQSTGRDLPFGQTAVFSIGRDGRIFNNGIMYSFRSGLVWISKPTIMIGGFPSEIDLFCNIVVGRHAGGGIQARTLDQIVMDATGAFEFVCNLNKPNLVYCDCFNYGGTSNPCDNVFLPVSQICKTNPDQLDADFWTENLVGKGFSWNNFRIGNNPNWLAYGQFVISGIQM